MSQPDIDDLLRKGYHSSKFDGVGNRIFFVGETGNGKSSLLKFILQDPTLQIIKNRTKDCIYVDNEETIGSNNHDSKTVFPNVARDPETKSIIVDLAGFQDTRHENYDLIDAFINKSILDKAEMAKIILVENYNNLKENGAKGTFQKNLELLAILLKHNYKQFADSIGIVATKVSDRDKTDEELQECVQIYLGDLRNNLKQKIMMEEEGGPRLELLKLQHKIIKNIVAENLIGIFKSPRKVGDPWEQDEPLENRSQLRKFIFKEVQYTTKAISCSFYFSVAPKTIVFIRDKMIPATNDTLMNIFGSIAAQQQTKFSQEFDKCVESDESALRIKKMLDLCSRQIKICEAVSQIQTVADLKLFETLTDEEQFKELGYQVAKKEFFHSVALNNEHVISVGMFRSFIPLQNHFQRIKQFYFFLDCFSRDLATYEIRLHNNAIYDMIEGNFQLSALLSLGFSVETCQASQNIQMDQFHIDEVKRVLREMMQTPVCMDHVESTLRIQGRFIILSQIITSNWNELVEHIVIMASETVYIDCDLTLQHTHLTILCPTIELVGGEIRCISMRGSDASGQDLAKASDALNHENRGKDGRHGRDDNFSPGNLKIVTLTIKNPKFLRVESIGGNGGDGQHGGDGMDATTPDPPIYSVHERDSRYDLNKFKSDITGMGYRLSVLDTNRINELNPLSILTQLFVTNIIQEIVRIENVEPERPPTDGGCGGNASAGARAGEIGIFIVDQRAQELLQVNSTDGLHGNPGQGGRKGENAPIGSFRIHRVDCEIRRLVFCEVKEVRIEPLYNTEESSGDLDVQYRPAVAGQPGAQPIEHVFQQMHDVNVNLEVLLEELKSYLETEKLPTAQMSQSQALVAYLQSLN